MFTSSHAWTKVLINILIHILNLQWNLALTEWCTWHTQRRSPKHNPRCKTSSISPHLSVLFPFLLNSERKQRSDFVGGYSCIAASSKYTIRKVVWGVIIRATFNSMLHSSLPVKERLRCEHVRLQGTRLIRRHANTWFLKWSACTTVLCCAVLDQPDRSRRQMCTAPPPDECFRFSWRLSCVASFNTGAPTGIAEPSSLSLAHSPFANARWIADDTVDVGRGRSVVEKRWMRWRAYRRVWLLGGRNRVNWEGSQSLGWLDHFAVI